MDRDFLTAGWKSVVARGVIGVVYVIVRGKSMADRSVAGARAARKQRGLHDAAGVASSGQTTRRSRRSRGSSRPPAKRPIAVLDHDPAMLPSIGILVGSSGRGARGQR
jgi:hypothetical protein